jgi:hypothetical protein
MSQTNATAGVASPGNTVGLPKGRKTTGEQVLGCKEEKLGELVYKFNTKDQADIYLRITEAIADFVGVEYGRDMRMLVKHGTEKTFTEPRIPQEQRRYSRIDGEVQDRTRDCPTREERISRQQRKGICYYSRTVHSQCEEQIGKRIRIRYLGNE